MKNADPDYSFLENWVQSFLNPAPFVEVKCLAQGWGSLQVDKSISGMPLRLNGVEYTTGFGTHAQSEILVRANRPLTRFTALGGVDDYAVTRRIGLQIVFTVEVNGAEIWRSPILSTSSPTVDIDVPLNGAQEFTLRALELTNDLHLANVDLVNPQVVLADGSRLDIVVKNELSPKVPFSFQYGERNAQEFFQDCDTDMEPVIRDGDKAIHRAIFRDRVTALELQLELVSYTDFPAVEWLWRIKNQGSQNTPILQDIQAIDLNWTIQATEKVLHYSLGSDSTLNDFLYKKTAIDQEITLGSIGGRSSCGHLPFFNIQADHQGLICAVGWSGQWKAVIGHGNSLSLKAGLEHTHLVLHPGEEIRTPRMLLMHWEGEPIDGNNLLRRLILKHHTHRVDGQVPTPITFPTWGGMKSVEHMKRLDVLQRNAAGYEYYWVDAGWYGPAESYSPDEHEGDWGSHVGNWSVNPVAHPAGLKPLSDKIHEVGMKFLLWFEPERAVAGTPLSVEHPDWFLGDASQLGQTLLLNLANPEALRGITDLISSLITEHGVDGYRQDFNMEPMHFWRQEDAPDRQGMTEIRHIENLYAFWDTLLARHPHLIIDNCASGGRRIDLETISRSIPLWRSDVQCHADFDPLAGQVQTQGLAHWVPCSATGTHLHPGDSYNFRSAMCTGVAFHAGMYEYTPIPEDYPWDWHQKMMREHRQAIPYYLGDYYPLVALTRSHEDWTVYQMHDPKTQGGCVVALRREESAFERGQFRLKGLKEGVYQFEDADSGEAWQIEKSELTAKGLSIHLPDRRSSRLIFYRGPK